MKLEEVLQQEKGFPDEWEKAFLNIIYTANYLNYHQYQFMKEFGLTTEQYNILRILKGQQPEPASINLLKERMLNKMSNASRLVENLERKQLVTRHPSAQDRRQMDVAITQKGLDLLKTISRHYPGARGNYGHISEEDMKTLNNILDRIRDA
jgi:DNA-binding MarR family transcriptional regulator